jgi:hypothetical protein
MIEILLGTVQAIMNPSKMAELDLTPKTGYSAITTVILEGVLTEKGRPSERRGETVRQRGQEKRRRARKHASTRGDV